MLHPKTSGWWCFVLFFLLLPSKPFSHTQLTGLYSYCQRNMIYTSPHWPKVYQARLIKFNSVTHSSSLLTVLVSIANKPPFLILIYFLSALLFIEYVGRFSPYPLHSYREDHEFWGFSIGPVILFRERNCSLRHTNLTFLQIILGHLSQLS